MPTSVGMTMRAAFERQHQGGLVLLYSHPNDLLRGLPIPATIKINSPTLNPISSRVCMHHSSLSCLVRVLRSGAGSAPLWRRGTRAEPPWNQFGGPVVQRFSRGVEIASGS